MKFYLAYWCVHQGRANRGGSSNPKLDVYLAFCSAIQLYSVVNVLEGLKLSKSSYRILGGTGIDDYAVKVV